MKLQVKRKWRTEDSTIGEFWINGTKFCYTLEDTVREPGVKVKGQTAIPEGTYKVIIDKSARFNRLMPHILDVPMFEGIRIHAGNSCADTEGCILLGMTREKNLIGQSRLAYNQFFERLKLAIAAEEEVTIEVGGEPERPLVCI